jgi:hypothetical protein
VEKADWLFECVLAIACDVYSSRNAILATYGLGVSVRLGSTRYSRATSKAVLRLHHFSGGNLPLSGKALVLSVGPCLCRGSVRVYNRTRNENTPTALAAGRGVSVSVSRRRGLLRGRVGVPLVVRAHLHSSIDGVGVQVLTI